jgi:hypothetical protein
VFAGGSLTITDGNTFEARIAFYNSKQNLTSFNVEFTYSATKGTPFLADGAAFVIHNDPQGVHALGAVGGSLGYAGFGGGPGGISPSVALEINVFAGYTGRGIMVTSNGSVFNYIAVAPVDLSSGHPIDVKAAGRKTKPNTLLNRCGAG